jgi:hypothetical protein
VTTWPFSPSSAEGRLVGEDQLGLFGKSAGNGDTLLLPARKPVRPVVEAMAEADVVERAFGSGFAVAASAS